MRISKIRIQDYRQFKDLELDLTYPLGHQKAGKPLDKICFIGQSGTGKTTLLKAISDLAIPPQDSPMDTFVSASEYASGLYGAIEHKELSYSKVINDTNARIIKYGDFKKADELIGFDMNNNFLKQLSKYAKEDKIRVLFFPDKQVSRPAKNYSFNEDQILYDFTTVDIDSIYKDFKKRAKIWDDEIIKLSLLLMDSREVKDKFNKINNQINNWLQLNPPPTDVLGYIFKDLLQNFYLEFPLGIHPSIIEKNSSIFISHIINKKMFEFNSLSSGIQSIIYKSLPIHLYSSSNSTVLIDEIDSSLYPDVQRTIIDFLIRLSPDSQFFFSTHSPVILSSFEPWEVIELVFDNDGYVHQRPYYDINMKRHVDNYLIWPQYLRWDDILMKSFGTKFEGNESMRNQLVTKALMLKKSIEKLKKEKKDSTNEYYSIVKEYIHIAEKIGWNHAQNK